jgi:hypothetical protein
MSGSFEFARYYCLGNHIGYAGTNHVAAKPFAVFGIENNFYKTVGVPAAFAFPEAVKGNFPILSS